jgi:foldase protein PrsA
MIWSHRFLQRLRFLNTFNKEAPSDVTTKPPTDTELRDKVLAGLIEDKIIFSEADKRGISVTADELNQAYDAQTKQVENLEEKIHQLYGMSVQEFKEIIAERLLKEKVKSVAITRVRIRHILVTTPQAAAEVKKQLAAGTDFAAVAKQFSQDAKTKDSGGDLGYWTKGELIANIGQGFEDAVFGLAVNAFSDSIQTQYGYHIVLVTEKTGDNYQSYDEWYAGVVKSYKIVKYLKP